MTFSIYDAAVGGTLIWSEPLPTVTVTAGLFTVLLGSLSPLDVSIFDGTIRYLGITVGADPEISPRIQLVSVPYSLRSQKADVTDLAFFADSTDAITDGAVDMADIGQAGAVSGQVLKWNGSAWAPAADDAGSDWNWSDSSSHGPDSVLFADSANHADNADNAASAAFSDSTEAITDGAVDMADIGQAGAVSGQVLKWNGSAWAPAADDAGSASGWTDDGTVVRLDAAADSVGIGTTTPSEKLDVVGNFIVSGKANIGPNNANAGLNAFVTGTSNSASGDYSTVGGGQTDTASGLWSTVAGGRSNTASGSNSTVGGGSGNTASGDKSTVAGGQANTASNFRSTVSGGFQNSVSGIDATVSGGGNNTASGNYSTVAGGRFNTASGHYSVAIGNVAKAQYNGSIVIAANSSGNGTDSIASGGNQQLVIRADGGLYLTNVGEAPAPYDPTKIITTRGGAYLSGNGTTWTNASDKNQKENFTDIDSEQLLEKISALPISRWNYKDEDETVTHIGPVAQDFYALFGVGADDISISTIDPAGIALAAIKELIKKSKRVDALEQNNRELNERLEKLEKMIDELSKK